MLHTSRPLCCILFTKNGYVLQSSVATVRPKRRITHPPPGPPDAATAVSICKMAACLVSTTDSRYADTVLLGRRCIISARGAAACVLVFEKKGNCEVANRVPYRLGLALCLAVVNQLSGDTLQTLVEALDRAADEAERAVTGKTALQEIRRWNDGSEVVPAKLSPGAATQSLPDGMEYVAGQELFDAVSRVVDHRQFGYFRTLAFSMFQAQDQRLLALGALENGCDEVFSRPETLWISVSTVPSVLKTRACGIVYLRGRRSSSTGSASGGVLDTADAADSIEATDRQARIFSASLSAYRCYEKNIAARLRPRTTDAPSASTRPPAVPHLKHNALPPLRRAGGVLPSVVPPQHDFRPPESAKPRSDSSPTEEFVTAGPARQKLAAYKVKEIGAHRAVLSQPLAMLPPASSCSGGKTMVANPASVPDYRLSLNVVFSWQKGAAATSEAPSPSTSFDSFHSSGSAEKEVEAPQELAQLVQELAFKIIKPLNSFIAGGPLSAPGTQ